jgi:hypothetical protein
LDVGIWCCTWIVLGLAAGPLTDWFVGCVDWADPANDPGGMTMAARIAENAARPPAPSARRIGRGSGLAFTTRGATEGSRPPGLASISAIALAVLA